MGAYDTDTPTNRQTALFALAGFIYSFYHDDREQTGRMCEGMRHTCTNKHKQRINESSAAMCSPPAPAPEYRVINIICSVKEK